MKKKSENTIGLLSACSYMRSCNSTVSLSQRQSVEVQITGQQRNHVTRCKFIQKNSVQNSASAATFEQQLEENGHRLTEEELVSQMMYAAVKSNALTNAFTKLLLEFMQKKQVYKKSNMIINDFFNINTYLKIRIPSRKLEEPLLPLLHGRVRNVSAYQSQSGASVCSMQ